MEKLAFNMRELCQATGLGKTSLYAAIRAGELEKFKACGRTLVSRESAITFIEHARNANPNLPKSSIK